KEAMKRVKPHLVEGDDMHHGECVMGTVEGDIHDLGKNIVSTLLECSGFRVIDLGVDVPPARFVEAVGDSRARLVGMSLLLTTAIDSMGTTIKALTEAGFRDHITIMIGGAPTSERFRSEIGADFYGRDAVEALAIARRVYNDAT
ncbi:MAG: cobalamin-dependent protein, partial [Deltaproteobacteria bacterium]|nr:cobalamin-dependent protein [Deltaproteobacteria bacterium]